MEKSKEQFFSSKKCLYEEANRNCKNISTFVKGKYKFHQLSCTSLKLYFESFTAFCHLPRSMKRNRLDLVCTQFVSSTARNRITFRMALEVLYNALYGDCQERRVIKKTRSHGKRRTRFSRSNSTSVNVSREETGA